MLAGLREVLDPAVDAGTGIGAFNVICLEHAEAVIWGAEAANLPVVLQVSENAVLYHRSLEPILIATVALARNADIPAVVHLDHVTDADLVRAGVELGATSVMFDGSRRCRTRRTSRSPPTWSGTATPATSQVEAELGEVGGKDGVHSSTALAPDRRRRPSSSDDTGVDALAVAVGSSHAMTERTTRLDLELVERLRQAVDVPLVLHGSSGVPDDELVRAVRAGLTKINIGTHLNATLTRSVRPEPGRPATTGGSAPVPRSRPRRRGRRGRARLLTARWLTESASRAAAAATAKRARAQDSAWPRSGPRPPGARSRGRRWAPGSPSAPRPAPPRARCRCSSGTSASSGTYRRM